MRTPLLQQQVSGWCSPAVCSPRRTRRTTTTTASPSAMIPVVPRQRVHRGSTSVRPRRRRRRRAGVRYFACSATSGSMVPGPADHVPSRRKCSPPPGRRRGSGHGVTDEFVERSIFSSKRVTGRDHPAPPARGHRHRVRQRPARARRDQAARRRGLAVPGDVSVVGFDDSAFMTCTEPPLTTVRQPIEAMGRAAVDLLCASRSREVPPGRAALRA